MRIYKLWGALVLTGLVFQGFTSCVKQVPGGGHQASLDGPCPPLQKDGSCDQSDADVNCTINIGLAGAAAPFHTCIQKSGHVTFRTDSGTELDIHFCQINPFTGTDGGMIVLAPTDLPVEQINVVKGTYTFCVAEKNSNCCGPKKLWGGTTGEIEVVSGPIEDSSRHGPGSD